MKKSIGTFIAIFLVTAGLVIVWIGLERPVKVITPNGVERILSRSLKVDDILAQSGITLGAYDQVFPELDSSVGWAGSILIRRASLFRVIDLTRDLDISIPSLQRIPANILQEAGISLFPGDQILWNGQSIKAGVSLPYQPASTLQIIPALKLEVNDGQHLVTTYSSASTLGQALWRSGISLQTTDGISERLGAPLRFLDTVQIQHSYPIDIEVDDQVITTKTTANTVGEALNQAEISLQGMDYSIPNENAPLPANRQIEIVRVHEAIVLQQTVLPYSSEVILDPNTPLDQQRVLENGQYGLMVNRERIRYENEEEVQRTSEAEWIAAEPEDQLIGIGTQVNISTVDTPQGTLEFWRSLSAYATSYSPCRLGTGECSYTTAAGMELKRGVVAVKCSLFSSMRGQRVYIPGYGVAVIGDCGGGIPGTFWVDLGFSDENYESWHSTVTVYFLTPVPATIPYDLQ
jgi:uncharacterized protein YabE (DUF348 family)